MNSEVLSRNIEEFKTNLKFIMTKTGGIAGMGHLFLITPEQKVYKSNSHSAYDLKNIENEVIEGTYLGTLSVDISDIYTGKAEKVKTEWIMMDAINVTIYCTANAPDCNICYAVGDIPYHPTKDEDKYEQMIKEVDELYRW